MAYMREYNRGKRAQNRTYQTEVQDEQTQPVQEVRFAAPRVGDPEGGSSRKG